MSLRNRTWLGFAALLFSFPYPTYACVDDVKLIGETSRSRMDQALKSVNEAAHLYGVSRRDASKKVEQLLSGTEGVEFLERDGRFALARMEVTKDKTGVERKVYVVEVLGDMKRRKDAIWFAGNLQSYARERGAHAIAFHLPESNKSDLGWGYRSQNGRLEASVQPSVAGTLAIVAAGIGIFLYFISETTVGGDCVIDVPRIPLPGIFCIGKGGGYDYRRL